MTITMLSFNFLADVLSMSSWIPVCVQEANKMRMPTILKILLGNSRLLGPLPSWSPRAGMALFAPLARQQRAQLRVALPAPAPAWSW